MTQALRRFRVHDRTSPSSTATPTLTPLPRNQASQEFCRFRFDVCPWAFFAAYHVPAFAFRLWRAAKRRYINQWGTKKVVCRIVLGPVVRALPYTQRTDLPHRTQEEIIEFQHNPLNLLTIDVIWQQSARLRPF